MINGSIWNDNPGAVEDEETKAFDVNRAEAIPHGHEGAAGVGFRQLVGRSPGNQEGEDGGIGGILGAKVSDFEEMGIVSGSEDVRVSGATEVGDG